MVVRYWSYAVIGVEIDPAKLYKKEIIRTCNCDIIFDKNRPPNFCLKCGNKWVRENLECIDNHNEIKGTLFGYEIIYNTDNKKAYIGIVISSSDDDGDGLGDIPPFTQLPSLDLSKLKKELKSALGINFWDEKKFGLYSVLYCSY